MPNLRAPLIGSLVSASLCACTGEEAPSGAFERSVRDSAGVEIVENIGDPAAIPELSLSAPILRLGEVDGAPEYQFFRVSSAVRLADGSLVVASGGSSVVRVFWPDGSLRVEFGGEGQGPQEFRFPWSVWDIGGDSLLVYDWGNQRLATWSADGEFHHVRTLEPRFINAPFALGRFADGSVLFGDQLFDIPDTGFEPTPLWLHRYEPSGTLRDTVGQVLGMELGHITTPQGSLVGSRHFAGAGTAHVLGEHVVMSDGRSYELRVMSDSGELVRVIRWSGRDQTVRPEDLDAYLDKQLARTETPEQERRAREFHEATPAADAFGTILNVTTGADGSIWALEFERPQDPPNRRWLVFDAEGGLTGRLTLPPMATLISVGADHLVVVELDDLDVEYVVVYARPTLAG